MDLHFINKIFIHVRIKGLITVTTHVQLSNKPIEEVTLRRISEKMTRR